MASVRAWRLCLFGMTVFLGSPVEAATAEVVRMGLHLTIIRDLNRQDTRAAMEVWTRELTAKFQVPSEVHFYEDMGHLRRDFDAGGINFVLADAMSLVRHFKPGELAEGFTTTLPKDASLLLLARHRGATDKPDLAGKRVALVSQDPVSDTYLESLCLRHYQRPCVGVMKEIQTVPNNHQAVTRLFFGQVDLALVNRHGLELAGELNPQLARAGEPVARMEFDTQYFGFFKASVRPAFRSRALRIIPGLHREPRGRQLLELFRAERLSLAEPDALRPFYALEHDYRALLAKSQSRSLAR